MDWLTFDDHTLEIIQCGFSDIQYPLTVSTFEDHDTISHSEDISQTVRDPYDPQSLVAQMRETAVKLLAVKRAK
jgi:hypothetical protein